MKILDGQKKDLKTVKDITSDGSALLIKGKLFGTMPVTARRPKISPPKALCPCENRPQAMNR